MDFRPAVLSSVLAWYAHPDTWRSVLLRAPYSSGSVVSAVRDAGAVARRAVEARHDGELLSAACDAWGLSLLEVARRVSVTDSEVSGFAMTGRADELVREKLLQSLLSFVKERSQ